MKLTICDGDLLGAGATEVARVQPVVAAHDNAGDDELGAVVDKLRSVGYSLFSVDLRNNLRALKILS